MLELPVRLWGDPASSRRVLLIHGLTSSGATWWRLAEHLASDGWSVTAVDLRGNGTAPTAESYSFDDYAGDLPAGPWDLVIGHSLGGAVAVVAAAAPGFAARLALLDPALEVSGADLDELLAGELWELTLDTAGFRALRPTWHPLDVAHKATAVAQATPRMVELTVSGNRPWNVLDRTRALTVPTLIIGGDHRVFSMLATASAEALVAANPGISYRVVEGAGHSPQRDRPDETLAALRDWLGGH